MEEQKPEEAERNKKIAAVYKANNYKKSNLHLKVQAEHPDISRRHVQQFLKQDYTTQLTQTKQKDEAKGHIVATNPNELWQFDILDLSRYAKKNEGIRYILACVDVFSRKAYVEAMKQKNAENVEKAFDDIIKKANATPESLISDQDGAFLGGVFTTYLKNKNIILNTNALRDHHVMGIIDNFAFRIKNILTKGFLNDNNVEWLGKIQGIVDQYNKDGTEGLGGIAPNDAGKKELESEEKAPQGRPEGPEEKKQRELRNAVRMSNYQKVLNMNLEKQRDNNQMSSLSVDDKVRVTTMGKSALQKGTDPKWSDEVFTVKGVKGNTISLSNDQVYKRNDLLKVPEGTDTTGKNAIDKEKEALATLKNKLKKKAQSKKATINTLLKSALKTKKAKAKAKAATITVVPVTAPASAPEPAPTAPVAKRRGRPPSGKPPDPRFAALRSSYGQYGQASSSSSAR